MVLDGVFQRIGNMRLSYNGVERCRAVFTGGYDEIFHALLRLTNLRNNVDLQKIVDKFGISGKEGKLIRQKSKGDGGNLVIFAGSTDFGVKGKGNWQLAMVVTDW